jgi:hypothetical protein
VVAAGRARTTRTAWAKMQTELMSGRIRLRIGTSRATTRLDPTPDRDYMGMAQEFTHLQNQVARAAEPVVLKHRKSQMQ